MAAGVVSVGKRAGARRPGIWRRVRRGVLVLAAAVGLGGVLLALYVARTWNRVWDAPIPAIHASSDPAVIARGEYLVYGPAHCVECHAGSTDDVRAATDAGQRVALTGGKRFAAPPLGVIYSRNITPDLETGIGRYTDGEIARLLRYSVRPDGKASIRLLMPYGDMSDADLTAVVSFLRAQAPITHVVPENDFTLIGKVVKSLAPAFKPRERVNPPALAPEERPTPQRGEYLARSVANCVGCHTPLDPVTLRATGPEFSGGSQMEPADAAGVDRTTWFRVPNLTPAHGSALSRFPDRATFIARFQRGGRTYDGSPMPWECFGRMNDTDAGALYEFFRTLAPQPGPTGEAAFRKES